MPADDSLKRLGGGRWETRDGRFAIEPQSGTWVVVDNSQTDELGLPLVRGPFGSLTAAREAIEAARQAGPAESPLAERIRQAGPPRRAGEPTSSATKRTRRTGEPSPDPEAPTPPPSPPSPPEPKWLRDLTPARHHLATELIKRLADLGIGGAEAVARAEIADDRPALARLALERRLQALVTDGKQPAAAVRATVAAILRGSDRELGARWHLVDENDRRIDQVDVGD
jgi:hypothetical protein